MLAQTVVVTTVPDIARSLAILSFLRRIRRLLKNAVVPLVATMILVQVVVKMALVDLMWTSLCLSIDGRWYSPGSMQDVWLQYHPQHPAS